MSLFLPDPNRPANRPLRWTLVIVGILVIVGFLVSKPVYQRFKQRRAAALLEEGLVFQRDGQLDLAYQRGRAAADLIPDNIPAFRLVAQVLTQQKKQEALGYWGRIVATPLGEEKDYLAIVDLGFQFNYLDTVEKYLNEAIKKFPDSRDLLRRASLYFAAKNDLERSSYFAEKYLLKVPGDDDLRLMMVRQLLTLGQPQNEALAKTNLLLLARSPGAFALAAIELLTRFSDLSAAELEIMAGTIEKSGSTDPKYELIMRRLEVRLHPERKAAIFAAIINRSKNGSIKEFSDGAKWLFQQNAFPEVIELLSMRAKESKELFLIYCDSLAGAGKWEELEKTFKESDLPLENFFKQLYLARVTLELGRKSESEAHWKEAYSLAQASPNALQYFAEYCEKIGRISDSVQAYRALSRRTQTSRLGLLNLIRLTEAQGDLAGLRILLKDYESKFPDDNSVKNDINYVDLLTGNNVEAARGLAEGLFKQYPTVFAFRTTLALAYLKQNDVKKATELYKGLTIDWKTLLPGWQAVYVSVLGNSSATNEASAIQLASLINTNRLKDKEWELIRPWTAKPSQAGK